MKTRTLFAGLITGACVLAASKVMANPDAAARSQESYTGTIVSVKPQERMLTVKGFLFSKKFNLGDNCAYMMLNNPSGTINDLRPGEKVAVKYEDASGVLIADRIRQKPMTYEGTLKTIDPTTHTMTVHVGVMDKSFHIADDCKVMLRDNKTGTFADLQPGNQVTVMYETPNDNLVARQIAQTNATYAGELTAVDMTTRTVKARTLFDSKTFHLADHCAIVANGKIDGKLSDLRLGDQFTFSYDNVNGINIVNRIGPAQTSQKTETTSVESNP
jgi:hypothetical protein